MFGSFLSRSLSLYIYIYRESLLSFLSKMILSGDLFFFWGGGGALDCCFASCSDIFYSCAWSTKLSPIPSLVVFFALWISRLSKTWFLLRSSAICRWELLFLLSYRKSWFSSFSRSTKFSAILSRRCLYSLCWIVKFQLFVVKSCHVGLQVLATLLLSDIFVYSPLWSTIAAPRFSAIFRGLRCLHLYFQGCGTCLGVQMWIVWVCPHFLQKLFVVFLRPKDKNTCQFLLGKFILSPSVIFVLTSKVCMWALSILSCRLCRPFVEHLFQIVFVSSAEFFPNGCLHFCFFHCCSLFLSSWWLDWPDDAGAEWWPVPARRRLSPPRWLSGVTIWTQQQRYQSRPGKWHPPGSTFAHWKPHWQWDWPSQPRLLGYPPKAGWRVLFLFHPLFFLSWLSQDSVGPRFSFWGVLKASEAASWTRFWVLQGQVQPTW